MYITNRVVYLRVNLPVGWWVYESSEPRMTYFAPFQAEAAARPMSAAVPIGLKPVVDLNKAAAMVPDARDEARSCLPFRKPPMVE